MNIVMLLSNEIKQYYVIRELSKSHTILGALIEDRYTSSNRIRTVLRDAKNNPFKIGKVAFNKLRFMPYEARDRRIINRYFLKHGRPILIDDSIPVRKIGQINSPEAVSFIKELSPELIIVFGTSLVREEIVSIPSKGIINVHTGLSPYYRGGQCAFWCLYNEEPEYIGVTIHWLSQEIDKGDIILQRRPEIEEDDVLASIECKLALLATQLLIQAIGRIERGTAKRVKQGEEGRLYLSREFTLDKRLEFEKRLRQGLLQRYRDHKDKVYDKVKIVDG